jgi:hypothetical protein
MTLSTYGQPKAQATRAVRERGRGDSGGSWRDNARRAGGMRPHGSPSLPIRFALGRLVATPGALEAMQRTGANPVQYLARHATCDWGDVDAEDWTANDRAVVDGARLLSAYRLPDGTPIWVITEADRSATTFLLPSEY